MNSWFFNDNDLVQLYTKQIIVYFSLSISIKKIKNFFFYFKSSIYIFIVFKYLRTSLKISVILSGHHTFVSLNCVENGVVISEKD